MRVDGASRRERKASPPLKYLMALGSVFPEGQRREWVTHRETSRQAPDQRARGPEVGRLHPPQIAASAHPTASRHLWGFARGPGMSFPGLRLLPLPQLQRQPWGCWVSVPMVLSFHPLSQCQQASGMEITPVVPSAPMHLWLLSPLGLSPGRGAATRSSVAGRGIELCLFWEEVRAGAVLP